MKSAGSEAVGADMRERLSIRGMRQTAQRQRVYQVLLARPDHPTAEDLFRRAKRSMPDLSLATVYNALEALVRCGLVRRVTVDPSVRRFCPNMNDHSHFCCERCGHIYDVPAVGPTAALPPGFRVRRTDVSFRGLCAGCAAETPSDAWEDQP